MIDVVVMAKGAWVVVEEAAHETYLILIKA